MQDGRLIYRFAVAKHNQIDHMTLPQQQVVVPQKSEFLVLVVWFLYQVFFINEIVLLLCLVLHYY